MASADKAHLMRRGLYRWKFDFMHSSRVFALFLGHQVSSASSTQADSTSLRNRAATHLKCDLASMTRIEEWPMINDLDVCYLHGNAGILTPLVWWRYSGFRTVT